MQSLGALVFAVCLCYVYGACPAGWKEFGGSCYHFETDLEYWVDARMMCLWQGADLMKIETPAEQAWFVQQAHTYNHTGEDEGFWLGSTDLIEEGKWVWEGVPPNGASSPLSAGYSVWGKGQPNNREDREDCLAAVLYFDYIWSDEYCDGLNLQYVCEKSATSAQTVG